jgi:hypothetical protein
MQSKTIKYKVSTVQEWYDLLKNALFINIFLCLTKEIL